MFTLAVPRLMRDLVLLGNLFFLGLLALGTTGLTTRVAAQVTPTGAGSTDLSRVELILVLDPDLPMGDAHQWLERLSKAGIERVRIRASREGDRPEVESIGTGATARFRVTGIVRATELRLPEARFRPSRMNALKEWLTQLPAREASQDAPDLSATHGLDPEVFENVFAELAEPVETETKGLPLGFLLSKIAGKLDFPIRIDANLEKALHEISLKQEYRGFSRGTTLASALRPLGLILKLGTEEKQPVAYVIARTERSSPWPVGWEREKSQKELIPGLYSTLRTQLDGVPLDQVLQAVSQRLNVPHLMDQKAMQSLGIDPTSKEVTLSTREITYDQLLGQALYRCKLKYEVRIDATGNPFLWITSLRPLEETPENRRP